MSFGLTLLKWQKVIFMCSMSNCCQTLYFLSTQSFNRDNKALLLFPQRYTHLQDYRELGLASAIREFNDKWNKACMVLLYKKSHFLLMLSYSNSWLSQGDQLLKSHAPVSNTLGLPLHEPFGVPSHDNWNRILVQVLMASSKSSENKLYCKS